MPESMQGEDKRRKRYAALLQATRQNNVLAGQFADATKELSDEDFQSKLEEIRGGRYTASPGPQDFSMRAVQPTVNRESRLQEDATRQQGQESPLSGQGSLYDKAVRHREVEEIDDPNQRENFFGPGAFQSTGNPFARKQTKEEYALEVGILSKDLDEFEQVRQGLTENYERMDPIARSHYNQMQKRVMGLEKAWAERRIKPIEYMRAMADLSARAKQVKWKYHFRAPGGEVGDVVEVDGIRKIRTSKGDLDPVAYTPEYIQQNVVKLPNGKYMVPTAPGKPHEIVDDFDVDDKQKKEYSKQFKDQWDSSMKAFSEVNGYGPGVDPATGRMANTPEKQRELSDFEERVHAQTISRMEAEARGIERLNQRAAERSGGAQQQDEQSLVSQRQGQRQASELQQQMQQDITDGMGQQMQRQRAAQAEQQTVDSANSRSQPGRKGVYDVIRALPTSAQQSPRVQEIAKQISAMHAMSGGSIKGTPLEDQFRQLVKQLKEEVNKIEGRAAEMKR